MIYINKNNVNNYGSSILSDINDFYNDIKKIETIIKEINVNWQGADALNYVNKIETVYIPKLYDAYKNIISYGEYIKNVSGAYDLLDESYYNKQI